MKVLADVAEQCTTLIVRKESHARGREKEDGRIWHFFLRNIFKCVLDESRKMILADELGCLAKG